MWASFTTRWRSLSMSLQYVLLSRLHGHSCSASGETIARIYNLGLSDIPDARPLNSDTVWHVFYLHALLLHAQRTHASLVVPHSGVQSDRFNDALAARNKGMIGVGQPQWAHACDVCEQVFEPNEDIEDAPWGKWSSDFHFVSPSQLNTTYLLQNA